MDLSLLEAGRAAAEALMVDTCTVTDPATAAGEFDDATGEWTYPETAVVYRGPCKVQLSDSLRVQDAEAGEVTAAVVAYALHVPVSASGVGRGMTATITAAVHDPSLVGMRLHIQAPHAGSFKTARRFACEVMS